MRAKNFSFWFLGCVSAFFLINLVVFTGLAWSEYPERPVTIMVAMDAGGATDIATRAMVIGVEKYLGKPFVIENRGATFEFNPRQLSGLLQKFVRAETVDDLDALIQCLTDLVLECRHFITFFQTYEGEILWSQADSGQGHVNGHIAASDDDHLLSKGNGVSKRYIP